MNVIRDRVGPVNLVMFNKTGMSHRKKGTRRRPGVVRMEEKMKKQAIYVLAVACLALAGISAAAAMTFLDPPVHTKTFVRQPDAATPTSIGPTVEGSSAKLQRSEDTVWIKVNTTGLPAGAYTLWAVIFNNPENCQTSPCGSADVGGDGVNGSVLWLTGGVVGEDNVGHFAGHIEEGMPPGQVLRGPGLLDAEGAEIHIIVRYHGPASDDPAVFTLQTTTAAGGCGSNFPFFACYEPQAARFPL